MACGGCACRSPGPAIAAANAYALARARRGRDARSTAAAEAIRAPAAALETALQAVATNSSDVREIVITHYHSDHAGTARAGWSSGRAPTSSATPTTPISPTAPSGPGRCRRPAAGGPRVEGVPEELLELFGDMREELEGIDAPVHPDRARARRRHRGHRPRELARDRDARARPSHICLYEPEHRTARDRGSRLAPSFTPGSTTATRPTRSRRCCVRCNGSARSVTGADAARSRSAARRPPRHRAAARGRHHRAPGDDAFGAALAVPRPPIG